MNLSGISVRDLLEKVQLGPQGFAGDVRRARSAVGHDSHRGTRQRPGRITARKSGVTSVVGTQDFSRLRLGAAPINSWRYLGGLRLAAMKKAVLERPARLVWPRRATAGGK